ncbi:hypothetical protein EDC04DRAFT_2926019 [Pisolithus marmoratus]|nr:hypothetical protein EDC04DRAFT_2926019 [Pisolithus marmoratus]
MAVTQKPFTVHNGRLAFIGRRVLESYYLLFSVHSTLLRWVPTIPRNTIEAAQEHLPDAELTDALSANPGIVRSVGLYKVMGETVQAVVGGVYHQFGGSVAHRLFHTRILPHILLPNQHGGVPMEFHARALSISERMGGLEASKLKQ